MLFMVKCKMIRKKKVFLLVLEICSLGKCLFFFLFFFGVKNFFFEKGRVEKSYSCVSFLMVLSKRESIRI